MAKVKITGHASGSGVLTVTAPNTSTDRTITLPDSTGTLLDTTSGLDATKLSGNLPAISAASLTNVPKDATVGGRKNLFINGGFDVWQRGTTLAGATSYLADRWYNGTTETQTRQTFTVGQTDVPHNPTYYHRGAGGSTEWYGLKQKIENVGITAGREVTLSYWAKGSSAFTNAPFRGQNFGSGGSSEVNAALSTASITTSWARYTHTFTLPSISGKTVGAGNYTQINLIRANVNNITIDLANCQLEFGSVATDFEQRNYGEELALCQRYFFKIPGNASDARCLGLGFNQNTTLTNLYLNFPVEMRSEVTVTQAGAAVLTGAATIAVNLNGIFDKGLLGQRVRFSAASGNPFVSDEASLIRLAAGASNYIQADAEL